MEESCTLANNATACIAERQDSIQTAVRAGPVSIAPRTALPGQSASGPVCSAGPGWY